MATIVNNPGPERVVAVEHTPDSTSGWAVAVVILIAVIGGLFAWYHYHRGYAAPAQPTNNTGSINIQLPAGNSGNPPSDASGGAAADGSASGGTN